MTALTTEKECAQNGITGPMLLSYVSPTSAANLPEVETIMNGLLLELVRFKDQHSQCTLKTLYGWTKDCMGKGGLKKKHQLHLLLTKVLKG